MPTFYGPRKSNRALWNQEDLNKAVNAVRVDKTSVRKAARDNNIPEKTLRNRLATGNFVKGTLGEKPLLGEDGERKLADHVRKLQSVGFAPSRKNLRKIAFNLAVKMNISKRFNEEKKIAGRDWYKSFMRRNPNLSIRKPRGISNARALGMNKEEVTAYFDLLRSTLIENDLMDKPGHIYNMDESGLQLNNEPGQVVAVKGSRDVHVRQSSERGETITVVACCNAEGSFLPPYCIFKGVNKQQVWQESMPPGAVIQMRKESAYIDEHLFMDWLEHHFIPRKIAGKCLLILDGHGSHTNCPEMLQMAADNDIHLLCLPSHTTHYLQPLDRSFFKPLKSYFRDACYEWGNANPNKKLERRHFGNLLSKSWSQAATSKIGISSFRATGIHPFCPSAIPEHAFLATTPYDHDSSSSESDQDIAGSTSSTKNLPGTSAQFMEPLANTTPVTLDNQVHINNVTTPTKLLNQVSPVPNISKGQPSRRKQTAMVLTHTDVIEQKKKKRAESRSKKCSRTLVKKSNMSETEKMKSKVNQKPFRKNAVKRKIKYKSTSNEETEMILASRGESDAYDENECAQCFEQFSETISKSDWIKCINCGRWLHESCTMYGTKCNMCARLEFKNLSIKRRH